MSGATPQCLHERVEAIVAQHAAAKEDGTITASEAFGLAGQIVIAAGQVMVDLVDSREKAGELATCCEEIFDKYIKPLDIKGVPNWIEPTIDGLIRANIRPAILGLVDLMEK